MQAAEWRAARRDETHEGGLARRLLGVPAERVEHPDARRTAPQTRARPPLRAAFCSECHRDELSPHGLNCFTISSHHRRNFKGGVIIKLCFDSLICSKLMRSQHIII